MRITPPQHLLGAVAQRAVIQQPAHRVVAEAAVERALAARHLAAEVVIGVVGLGLAVQGQRGQPALCVEAAVQALAVGGQQAHAPAEQVIGA